MDCISSLGRFSFVLSSCICITMCPAVLIPSSPRPGTLPVYESVGNNKKQALTCKYCLANPQVWTTELHSCCYTTFTNWILFYWLTWWLEFFCNLACCVSVRVLVLCPLAAALSYGWYLQLPECDSNSAVVSQLLVYACLWPYSTLLCLGTPVFGYCFVNLFDRWACTCSPMALSTSLWCLL